MISLIEDVKFTDEELRKSGIDIFAQLLSPIKSIL